MTIGYARVSTKHQRESLDQQIVLFKTVGCREVYIIKELENLEAMELNLNR